MRGILWSVGEARLERAEVSHRMSALSHSHRRALGAAARAGKAKPGPEMPSRMMPAEWQPLQCRLQIKPGVSWKSSAPLLPSQAQSPASAWPRSRAQTTSCVSLSAAKITCKQTKKHLKLSFPAWPDLPARLYFKGLLV